MRIFAYVLPFALCVAVAAAQSARRLQRAGGAAAAVQVTDHLTVKASTAARPAKPGNRVSLFLDIAPKPKMHVYAPGQKNYIPVSIALAKDAVIKAHPPVFPAAEQYFFKPLNETQLVYTKPFRIVQDVTLAEPLQLYTQSTLTITGTVRYQACDDEICYLPKSLPVIWTLPLVVPEGPK